MPHKDKLAEFEQLLRSIESGECVDTNLKLDDYGLDETDMARITVARNMFQQSSIEKPNNNDFPQDYLNLIRSYSVPQQQSTQPKPKQLFSFNEAVKELRRPKRTETQQTDNNAPSKLSLGLN